MKTPSPCFKTIVQRRSVWFLAFLLIIFQPIRLFSQSSGKLSLLESRQIFRPLDEAVVACPSAGTILVKDASGREYFRDKAGSLVHFTVGGALGKQSIALLDKKGKLLETIWFNVETRTDINDGGQIKELFDLLYNGMLVYAPKGYEEVSWRGNTYRYFVNWVLDNNNTMRGMQYFSPYSRDLTDLLRETQKPDGMIWSFVNTGDNAYHYYMTAYTPLGYFMNDGGAWFVRQPAENHVEYNYVNMFYQHWKASGDRAWMEKTLDCACRALDYCVTDSNRWSERFRLLKRPYTIDSWDFQVDDPYTPVTPLSPTMMIVPGKTKYGVFFGDNTGYYEACNQLAEMLSVAGQKERAEKYKMRGKEILDRLIALSWNGHFFTHFIDEDPTVKRDLGVDEKSQIAQGNMYSVNRGLSHDMIVSIIKTYLDLRTKLPEGSPGEWYAIYPPFEKGFGSHNSKWQYMNGGMAGHAMGELARGAYENGYEKYGTEIMMRMLELGKKHGSRIWFAYTGAFPAPPPLPVFRTLDISAQANMDLWDIGSDKVLPWMNAGKGSGNDMRGLPVGEQLFKGIKFIIADPEKTQRRIATAVSIKAGFPRHLEIPVNDTASAVYLLHSSSDNIPSNVAGSITFLYDDGTEASQYLFKGKEITNWWFSELNNERAGVAWSGPNPRSSKVGVCWAAIDNPHPRKRISKLSFGAPLEGGIYTVIAVSLADKPFYIRPKPESFGGPDNWAAANGMAALVEGLAGVKNEGLAFSEVKFAPRWTTAGTDSVAATIYFPASEGYFAYRYQHRPALKQIVLKVTGSGNQVQGHVLLPENASGVQSVVVNDKPVDFKLSKTENSLYVDFQILLPEVKEIKISYK